MTMTNFPTRAQIEAAEPVTFPDRPPDTTITIRAQLGDWPVDIAYRGKLEQLPAALARLASAGLQPRQAVQGAVQPAQEAGHKPKRQAAEPAYSSDGTPLCPKHQKPLKHGQWGMYCPAKDETTERGYCCLKFED